jgi:hypothetical protein
METTSDDIYQRSLAREMGLAVALAAVLGALQPAAWGLGLALNAAVSAVVVVVWVAAVAGFAALVTRAVCGVRAV